MTDRYSQVTRVLYRVLFLNLAVALAKIALGYSTGAVSILSDGFHSLTDSASNVVALIGVSVARRPPDANHPYGHRKYETMASLGILVFLVVVLVEVLTAAADRFVNGGTPRVFPEGIGLMTRHARSSTLWVVSYEMREGRRLKSEVLRADAKHTRSDVLTSGAVLGALLGVWWGYPLLDPMAALLVAGFIGHACWGIAQEASRILADEIVIAEGAGARRRAVGARGARLREDPHARVRGLRVPGSAPLAGREHAARAAHATSHIVKDRLMAQFPQLVDVVIHIEPPPGESREAVRSSRSGNSLGAVAWPGAAVPPYLGR